MLGDYEKTTYKNGEAPGISAQNLNKNEDKTDELDQAVAAHLADNMHIPSGLISIWSGGLDSIPDGWALCDGTNGTPNLQDKFIVGAGNAYAVGSTGGSASVALTTAQMPSHSHKTSSLLISNSGSHSHSGSTNSTGSHCHSYNITQLTFGDLMTSGEGRAVQATNTSTGSAGSHSHTVSIGSAGSHSHSISGSIDTTGSGGAHENRPPYYALAFIMKL